jgi:hypothetical protein
MAKLHCNRSAATGVVSLGISLLACGKKVEK